jgi:uncharacterized protein (TIGR03435 family)
MTKFMVLWTCAAALQAQPAFEVASVKPHNLPGGGFLRRPWSAKIECPPSHCGISGSRFSEEGASLADLIMDAYQVRRHQITGLPEWGDSGHDVYDIAARFADDQAPTLDLARSMLQTLLADRFQLKVHHATKELPIFELVAARGGPRLIATPGKPCGQLPGQGGRAAAGDQNLPFLTTWERVPGVLSMFAGRPVIDKTGLEGHYCTTGGQEVLSALDIRGLGSGRGGARGAGASEASAAPDADSIAASIFAEVQQKWGMKLESHKGPVDMVVIDSVARPTAN